MRRKWLPLAILLVGIQAWGAQQNGGQDARAPSQLRSAVNGDGEYRLGPEDVVQVGIWKEPDLSTTAVVRPDGKMSMPLIGELQVKGRSATQLQTEIKTKLAAYVADPVVTVIVKEINYPKVFVLGRVRKPDVYKIRQKTTVIDAIAMAGGFTDSANRNKVAVIRNSSKLQRIELHLKELDGQSAFYLEPSDTVYVQ